MKIDWNKISLKKLALLVSAALRKEHIDAVLVGGACVSLYSRNKYLSMDLDYISYAPMKTLEAAMQKLGFHRKSGRHFVHDACPYFIEFPPPPIAIGKEMPITEFSTIQELTLFTPTDCVKDRLAAYYHWHDPQSLEQALLVARAQPVNLKNIEKWSKAEGATAKFKRFKQLLAAKER